MTASESTLKGRGFILRNTFTRIVTGWWCNNHLEKYESQWEGLSHIIWEKKRVPNHQSGEFHLHAAHIPLRREAELLTGNGKSFAHHGH